MFGLVWSMDGSISRYLSYLNVDARNECTVGSDVAWGGGRGGSSGRNVFGAQNYREAQHCWGRTETLERKVNKEKIRSK